MYLINFETSEPIGPKFFVGARVTPVKFYGDQIFKSCLHQNLFHKIREKNMFIIKITVALWDFLNGLTVTEKISFHA